MEIVEERGALSLQMESSDALLPMPIIKTSTSVGQESIFSLLSPPS